MADPYSRSELIDFIDRDVSPDQARLVATVASLLPEDEPEDEEAEAEAEEKPATKRAVAKKK